MMFWSHAKKPVSFLSGMVIPFPECGNTCQISVLVHASQIEEAASSDPDLLYIYSSVPADLILSCVSVNGRNQFHTLPHPPLTALKVCNAAEQRNW